MLMGQDMKVNGKTISNMEMVLSTGLMVVSTLDSMSTQRKMAEVDTFGLTETSTMVNGEIMPLME